MQHSDLKLGLSKSRQGCTLGEFPVPALPCQAPSDATYCCEQVLAAVDTLMDNMPFHDDVAVILDQVGRGDVLLCNVTRLSLDVPLRELRAYLARHRV